MLLALLLASTFAVAEIPSPAGHSSAEPFLSSTKDGAVLSWLEPVAGSDRIALRVAQYHNGAWSKPKTIVERADLLANWADFPSVIADANGALFAQWLQKTGSHSYDVWMSVSKDEGRTWLAPFALNRDGRKAEHGFVSLAPLGKGGVAVAWLDGRKMKEGTEEGDMTLRYASVDGRGHVSGELEIDSRTCECCTTGMAVVADKPVIAYRDRSSSEIRDIAVIRPGSKPTTLHADGWKINGCPVNGPQIDAWRTTVAAVWFTGAGGRQSVFGSFSSDSGKTFGAPLAISTDGAIGRVDVVMIDGDTALVSWIQQTGATAELRGRIMTRDGAVAPSIKIADSATARAAGFPRMTRVGSEVLIAWTDIGTEKRVRVARLKP